MRIVGIRGFSAEKFRKSAGLFPNPAKYRKWRCIYSPIPIPDRTDLKLYFRGISIKSIDLCPSVRYYARTIYTKRSWKCPKCNLDFYLQKRTENISEHGRNYISAVFFVSLFKPLLIKSIIFPAYQDSVSRDLSLRLF